MWFGLALASALFQVLRNMTMKQLGHRLDEYINVWGRFTFLLPFALVMAWAWSGGSTACRSPPRVRGGCLAFGVCQTISTLALSKALKLGDISLVTALWKVSLIVLLVMGYLALRERPSRAGAGRRRCWPRRRVPPERAAGAASRRGRRSRRW